MENELTAKQSYEAKQKRVRMEMKKLEAALIKHSIGFNSNSTNWGYVGDLNNLLESLIEANKKVS